ncbi:MAG: hypothetical protein J5677_03755 [Bacteroidales bacterium]|nr:hypothetical protein [Bacteroidales bacterium]
MSDYEDIINLPHHVSTHYPHMSIEGRAGQFSPFAALTGLGAAIRRAAERPDEQIYFDDEMLQTLYNEPLDKE